MRSLPLRTCRYVREDGSPCWNAPMKSEDYCFWHSTEHDVETGKARWLGSPRRLEEPTVAGACQFAAWKSCPTFGACSRSQPSTRSP